MVIVQVLGGVASQMSSVARGYLVAQVLGKELILDVADYVSGYKFPYMMDYFDLPYRKLKYMHASPAVIGSHVIPDKVKEDFSPYIINTQGKTYADVCVEAQEHREQNIYLVGEGCTLPPRIDGLNFCMKENDFLDLFLQKINGHPSVAVHIRRTDFVTIGCAGEYSYYKAAVQYMKERISDAEFYFFSDNLEEVKKEFGGAEEYHYVRLPGGYATDVEELLCMSLCDHRIMTGNSGYSGWAERLNGNPGAINVVFSEESQEGRINITKQLVEMYSEREKEPKPLLETSMNAFAEIRVAIDEEQDYVKALQCLSRLCFDCKSITPEQYDMLYTYYENILFAREDYVKAEQALIKHLMWNPDSADVNGSMAVIKRLLGKNMASYMFASKACREEQGDGYKQLFHEVFCQDENYPEFVSLCQIPRMHFILCPNAEISFYVKHTDSLAIVLKQLGHEVSLLGSNGIPVRGSYTNEKLVDFCMRKKQEMDSCNVRNISLYHYAEAEEFNVYGDMLRAITKESPLPPVIIGRKLESILVAKEYPMIFWDYTEPLDKESQLIKYYDAWKRMDAIMRQAAKAILSTKNAASHAEKTRVLDSYVELKEYSLEAEKYFCTNYIEEDSFLNFAYETVKLATKCI